MEEEPLATLEFPFGVRLYMGKDHRWHGENSQFVRLTNSLMDTLPNDKYRPNWPHNIAHEIAAETGAKVVQSVKIDYSDDPPNTCY